MRINNCLDYEGFWSEAAKRPVIDSGFRFLIAGYRSQVSDCWLRIWIEDYRLQFTDYLFQIEDLRDRIYLYKLIKRTD